MKRVKEEESEKICYIYVTLLEGWAGDKLESKESFTNLPFYKTNSSHSHSHSIKHWLYKYGVLSPQSKEQNKTPT